jgi:hypothetical protein
LIDAFKSEDLARLAAYIDGEGHISIARVGRRLTHKMQVHITNTDVRLVVWLKDTFGGEYRVKGETVSKRRVWYWYVGSSLANSLLRQCLPYFIMKRDQAEIAIAYHRTVVELAAIPGRRRITEAIDAQREILAIQLKQAREDAAPVIN